MLFVRSSDVCCTDVSCFIYAGIYVWNDIGQGQLDNKPSYLNWDKEEPNDKHYDRFTPQRCDGEDCVQINIWNGVVTWFDLNCDIALPFICEKSRGKGVTIFSIRHR